MREGRFIQMNTEKWKTMDTALHAGNISPDLLAHYFIELTDDLAYARTFYPQGDAVPYLNNLTRSFHQTIYANKTQEKGRLYWFWQYELPELFYQYRRIFLYAFLFFILFVAIGVLSAKYDDRFVRLILGDSYVNMTLENISSGNPFGVYQDAGQIEMFFAIAINNIRVAFISFVSGIFWGIGPMIMNIKNSIMLGAFEYLFFSKNLGLKSILVIFIHGTLEIWSIIIAIASGMILGNGLIFPDTYSRMVSLQKAAKDGLKIVLGLVPLFLIAAFLESFITRYANMSILIKLAILGSSLTFLIWYFILYPRRIHRKIIQIEPKHFYSSQSKPIYKWYQKKYNSGK